MAGPLGTTYIYISDLISWYNITSEFHIIVNMISALYTYYHVDKFVAILQ